MFFVIGLPSSVLILAHTHRAAVFCSTCIPFAVAVKNATKIGLQEKRKDGPSQSIVVIQLCTLFLSDTIMYIIFIVGHYASVASSTVKHRPSVRESTADERYITAFAKSIIFSPISRIHYFNVYRNDLGHN